MSPPIYYFVAGPTELTSPLRTDRSERTTSCVLLIDYRFGARFMLQSTFLAILTMSLCSSFRLGLRRGRHFVDNFVNSSPSRLFAAVGSEDLVAMKLADLKEVYRGLGGKPGSLRKSELMERCLELMTDQTKIHSDGEHLQQSDVVSQDNAESGQNEISDETSQQSASTKRKRIKNFAPLASSESAFQSPTSPETDALPRYKHPYGPIRDARLDPLKSVYSPMDITFLGTASCIPSITRGVNCIALRYNADTWLFDCGEATQLQIQKSKVKPSKIKKIFITHNHGDHSFGLPGMLCLMGQATQLERNLHSSSSDERSEPVEIYGPEGTRDMIRAMIQLTYSRITIPHVIHELKNVPYLHGKYLKAPPPPMVRTRFDPLYGEVPGSKDFYPDENGNYHIFEDDDLCITAAAMQHTVPCVGYVVTEKHKTGRLRLDAVKDIVDKNFDGLSKIFRNPMKVYATLKTLKAAETFTFPDGTVVSAEDVLDPPRKGRKVVIMGDTCSGDSIANLSLDADVVVHEATNSWLEELDGARYPDYIALEGDTSAHGHSTPQMAGKFAKSINAKRLILTHFSPRYRGDESESSMRIMWRVEDQARLASGLYGTNDVIAAWDLMVYPVLDPEVDNDV